MHFVAAEVLMEVATGLARLQESLSDCKKPQEGTVLSVFLKFYIYTHVCMCICRNCLVFALYLWQKHNYFSFSKLCPFTGRPEYRQLFLFVFNCILHAEKLGLQKSNSYSV